MLRFLASPQNSSQVPLWTLDDASCACGRGLSDGSSFDVAISWWCTQPTHAESFAKLPAALGKSQSLQSLLAKQLTRLSPITAASQCILGICSLTWHVKARHFGLNSTARTHSAPSAWLRPELHGKLLLQIAGVVGRQQCWPAQMFVPFECDALACSAGSAVALQPSR